MITRPILAAKLKDFDIDIMKLRYPLYATPKIDGIRCILKPGKLLTRNFKNIPNIHINNCLLSSEIKDCILDGELVTFDSTGKMKSFNDVQSDIMSEHGKPSFLYLVFDYIENENNLQEPYLARTGKLENLIDKPCIVGLEPILINSYYELCKYEEQVLEDGYEGVMLRTGTSPYKCGRSTLNEQYLVAIKRFVDAEAKIVGFIEKQHNENEKTVSETGLSTRSKHNENMVLAGTLGAFIVQDPYTKIEFNIGTGLTDDLRQEIWDNKEKYIGKFISYKYQPHGVKEKPRAPVFRGFRSQLDM